VQNTINDSHAKLAESLYVADRHAREELEMRNKVQKKLKQVEKEREDQRLRDLAAQIHQQRSGGGGGGDGDGASDGENEEAVREDETAEEKEARKNREALRADRMRERKRDLRLEAMGQKTKTARDLDRDVSEKIALGMPTGKVAVAGEGVFDARLFNQSSGMDGGFGEDDEYNVYSKGLRAEKTQSIYRPSAENNGLASADEEYAKLVKTSKFKPDTGFAGADAVRGERSGPVQFEKAPKASDDPFGLGDFMTDSNKGRKVLDGIGKQGGMGASVGGTTDEVGGRRRMEFGREGEGERGSPKRQRRE
jgi:SNW domain-containing protein 1